jgi:hypothetical protein
MARGPAALALRALEAGSPLAGGRFRMLTVAEAVPGGGADAESGGGRG